MAERPEDNVRFTNLIDGAAGWKPQDLKGSYEGARSLVDQMKNVLGRTHETGATWKEPYVKGLDNRDRPEAGRRDDPFSMEMRRRLGPSPNGINGVRFPDAEPAAPNKNTPQFQLAPSFDRSKKKNTGGLSAARRHVVPDFFPGQLDQMKLGPVRIQPIGFQGASPQINLRTVAFKGFPKGIV